VDDKGKTYAGAPRRRRPSGWYVGESKGDKVKVEVPAQDRLLKKTGHRQQYTPSALRRHLG
jgi:hypothetical protein